MLLQWSSTAGDVLTLRDSCRRCWCCPVGRPSITQTGCQKAFADSFLAWTEMSVLTHVLWEVHQQLRAMRGMSVYLIHGCPFISSCVLFIKLMSGLKTCFKILNRPSIAGSTPCIVCFFSLLPQHSALMNCVGLCPYVNEYYWACRGWRDFYT